MKKNFLVAQPPLTKKYRLLVDDINETETFAMTLDIDKVYYNRRIIGEDLHIHLEIYTALSEKGTAVIMPLGRYVTIWQIRKDEKVQRIWFFDHQSNVSFRAVGKQLMGEYFSDSVYDEYERVQSLLRSTFTEELDIVELVRAEAS